MSFRDQSTLSSIWVGNNQLPYLFNLGIVDGTMGILSRKMALPSAAPANPIHYKEVISNVNTKK
jgi:hypothetical protein